MFKEGDKLTNKDSKFIHLRKYTFTSKLILKATFILNNCIAVFITTIQCIRATTENIRIVKS